MYYLNMLLSQSFMHLHKLGNSRQSKMEALDRTPNVSTTFEVNFTRKYTVKAINNPLNNQDYVLPLSNLDLLSGRFPVSYFYFYRNSLLPNDFEPIIDTLKTSLSVILSYYYPFAGRIVQNPKTNEPEIICDNTGALVVEANANVPLKELNFYNLDKTLGGKLVSINHPVFPMQVQVTHFTCGGISITFTFDHALGDASSFGKLLGSWSQIAQNKPISCIPDHGRIKLCARFPPSYHPSLDQQFTKCTMEEIMNIPTPKILIKRLYFIDESSINWLQSLACKDGKRRTKIEAFSAYIWKIMVRAIGENHERCKMGWLVDGRGRMYKDDDKNSMSNYIGNVLSLAFCEAAIEDLKQGSVSDIANKVHEAISKVANNDHFLDLIDWVECHRPGLMLSKVVLGRGGPALVLSSSRRFPVAELDFGFGSPVLGTVCSTVEKIGVAYLNQRPSATGNGSWTVSAMLWPELASALEADSIFQPMTASHLQL
ncbi:coniferyl alcohol acyltransferase [Ziziphus jujuba]|uniref:Coniferyl alcohol acyltransferase n=1 Tax=Ziziphus jujuba TaxID=326968 RepID=A0A6P4AN68_ZIZJJ|nr:coniferyl alcohol acyltransferase [Ziziphus jujuba]